MANEIIAQILSTFSETKGIGDMVVGIHAGHISGIPQPQYPCITIQRYGVGYDDRHCPYEEIQIMVSVFSEVSYDECAQLHESIKTVLHQQAWTAAGRSWISGRVFPPVEDSERVERTIFYQQALYVLQVLG